MSTKQMMNTEMNYDESTYWREMKNALKKHASHYVRMDFYPHNMSAWEKEHREIEHGYRTKLTEMMSDRTKVVKKMEAAEALVMMKARAEKEIEQEANRKKRASERLAMKQGQALNSGNIRRSTRIANKK